MTELWKQIPFSKNYEVSTSGNIRNYKTKHQPVFNIDKLKSTKTRIRITNLLNDDGEKKGYYLHRLIAQTFIPNPNNLSEVNHIDGDPYNNCVNNLEWITREDNMKHFHTNNKYVSKYMRKILVVNVSSNEIEKTYNCLEECISDLQLDISYNKLYRILNNSINKYKKQTETQNQKQTESNNIKKQKNNYVGVSWNIPNNKFIVYHNNKYLGSYNDEIEAAQRYDTKIRELYGTNAKVNFPTENTDEKQAIAGGKNKSNPLANHDTCEYEIGEHKIIKFEDENNNITYDDNTITNEKKDETTLGNENNVEWREVKEAPMYLVSNTGLVKLKRLNRILKGGLINGYQSVSLKINNSKPIHRLVHRLVAITFIENDDPNRVYVDHIDTNPLNNNISNLRWVTPKENMNNEQTKKNISNVKLQKSTRMYKIDIFTKQVVDVYDNYKELEEKEPEISYKTVYTICNYYKNIDNDNILYTQKKIDRYIFLFEYNLDRKDEYIEISLQNNSNKTRIVQIDKNTNEKINEFESMYQASKILNMNYSAISQVCNYYKYNNDNRPKCYKLKSSGGYIFKEC
jgi:hypothetical protein